MVDYVNKLRLDLVEQFRGKPNIEALASVIARQLQDIFAFYEQIRLETSLYSAVGKQLDGIGDIVVLSRMEAGLLAGDPIPIEVIDDDQYRKFLIYKILKNTTHTTYPDIIKAFKMFWDRPLYYTEDPSQPATMIFDTGEMDGTVDTSPLFDTPLIRAAGVTLKIYARTKTELPPTVIRIGSGFSRIAEDRLPWLERNIDYAATVKAVSGFSSISQDGLPEVERNYKFGSDLHTGGAGYSIMETTIGDVALRVTEKMTKED